jgi:structure-specific recognition protein 1
LYIPPPPDFENGDKSTPSNAELLQQNIMDTANITNTTGDVLVEFQESQGTFLTPRGRYTVELYDRFLRMRGNKYDYKIKYDDISRLFLLPKPDDVHMAFVIALDKPIRQGQQRYQMLVLQTTKEQSEITVNLDDSILQKEYNGDLQPVMTGSLSNLIAKTFKVIARKKVFIPGKFANANQQACVKCALRANEGHLYPLEKQFIFIHKPPVLIRFDEVDSVEFQRYAGGQGSTRNFDLCVTLKASAVGIGGSKEYAFSGIDRSDYAGLYNFLSGKKIRIKNLEGVGEEPGPSAPIYDENIIYGVDDEMGEEESEDEDFDENAKDSDDGSDSADDGKFVEMADLVNPIN